MNANELSDFAPVRTMLQAVCALIPHGDQYVVVSRRNDTTKWGLLGGKVDPGETQLQAVVREVFEESGLQLDPELLAPFFVGVCPGKGPADTYLVTTFRYKGTVDLSLAKPEKGLSIGLMYKADLCDAAQSPFADYNRRALSAL